ncbi:hypothetical protein B5X24_HaOG201891 [Helicoverpa armigera]|nr:hypothetical protein B5X24_HaOG201891 [Helicoverpa armigera]
MLLKIFCLCSVVACVVSAPPTDEVPPERQQPTVIPIVSQSEEFEADGKYKFSYETGNGIKREETSFDKVVDGKEARKHSDCSNEGGEDDDSDEIHVQQGSYSYTAPDGTLISVKYIADENGFRPVGNHINLGPQPPAESSHSHKHKHKSSRKLEESEEDSSKSESEENLPTETSESESNESILPPNGDFAKKIPKKGSKQGKDNKKSAPKQSVIPVTEEDEILNNKDNEQSASKKSNKLSHDAGETPESGKSEKVESEEGKKSATKNGKLSKSPANKGDNKPESDEGKKPESKEGQKPASILGEESIHKESEKPAPKEGEKPTPKEGEKPVPKEGEEPPAPKDGEKPASKEGEKPATSAKEAQNISKQAIDVVQDAKESAKGAVQSAMEALQTAEKVIKSINKKRAEGDNMSDKDTIAHAQLAKNAAKEALQAAQVVGNAAEAAEKAANEAVILAQSLPTVSENSPSDPPKKPEDNKAPVDNKSHKEVPPKAA